MDQDLEEDPSAEDKDQEDTHSSVERLHPNLATNAMGPRPLLTTRLLPTTAIDPQPPPPRRLLLTQTDLSAAQAKTVSYQFE